MDTSHSIVLMSDDGTEYNSILYTELYGRIGKLQAALNGFLQEGFLYIFFLVW